MVVIAQYIDPHSLWHDSLMKLQKCSTHGNIKWTFFKRAACLNLQGCSVTPVSSNESWVLFLCFFLFWSSQTTCLNDFFMLPKRSILRSPSLPPLVKTQQSDAPLHWVASFPFPHLPPWGKIVSLLSFDYFVSFDHCGRSSLQDVQETCCGALFLSLPPKICFPQS